jgi:hypothetical protein
MSRKSSPFTDKQWEHMARELRDGVRHLASTPDPDDPIREKFIELLQTCIDRGLFASGYAYMTFATVWSLEPDPMALLMSLAEMARQRSPLDSSRN